MVTGDIGPTFLSGSHIDVGVDIGMRRLAIGWPSYGTAKSIDLGSKPGPSRDWELRQLRQWMSHAVPSWAQLWIDQAYAKKGAVKVAQSLTETITAVLVALEWKHPPIIVHSTTWKAQVIGNYRAGKDDIREWLEREHPELAHWCHTEDEYDAMVIGLYGRGRSDGQIKPPDIRRPKGRTTRS